MKDRKEPSGAAADQNQTDAEWGFSEGKKGMATETKVGLLLIVVLLGTFGYVVYKKMDKKGSLSETLTANQEAPPPANTPANESGNSPPGEAPKPNPAASTHNHNHGPQANHQKDEGFFPQKGSPKPGTTPPVRKPPYGNAKDAEFPERGQSAFNRHRQQSTNAQQTSQQETGDDAFLPFDDEPKTAQREAPAPGLNGRGNSSAPTWNLDEEEKDDDRLNHDHGASDPPSGRLANRDGHGRRLRNGEQESPTGQSEPGFDDLSDPFSGGGSGKATVGQSSDPQRGPQQMPRDLDGGNSGWPRREAPAPGSDGSPGLDDGDDFADQSHGARGGQRPWREAPAPGDSTSNPDTGSDLGEHATHQHPHPLGQRPDPRQFEPRAANCETYVVQSGDNFWTISRKLYGTSRYYKALAEFNKAKVPDASKMRAGVELLTPKAEVLAAQFPQHCPGGNAPAGAIQLAGHTESDSDAPLGFFTDADGNPAYRVRPRDTLTGIALRHLGRASRWRQVYELNREQIGDPNNLTVGTYLRLPRDASRVELVEHASAE